MTDSDHNMSERSLATIMQALDVEEPRRTDVVQEYKRRDQKLEGQ